MRRSYEVLLEKLSVLESEKMSFGLGQFFFLFELFVPHLMSVHAVPLFPVLCALM